MQLLVKTPVRMIVAFLILALPWPSAAAPGDPPKAQQSGKFGPDDMVYARIDFSKMKPTYFVGQPMVVPVVLINHTRYPITIQTNFVACSNLSIKIRQPGQKSRDYLGTDPPGRYPVDQIRLAPLETLEHDVLIWGDNEEATSLAISQPGQYLIEISLQIQISESGASKDLPVGRFGLQFVPTPTNVKPLVDELIRHRAFSALQRKTLVPELVNRMKLYIYDVQKKKAALSVLTPYISMALGNIASSSWKQSLENNSMADEAIRYYAITARSDCAFQIDAYMELLGLYDKLGIGTGAKQTAEQILQVMPKDWVGRIGDSKLFKKYLINTDELDPAKYWFYFN